MKRPSHYGKLNWVNLHPEVQRIWSTRHEELEPEEHDLTWPEQHQEPCAGLIERKDLAAKILENTYLSERERLVIELVCMKDWTCRDVGQRLQISACRVQQITHAVLRRLRRCGASLTDDRSVLTEHEVTTWRQWSWMQKIKRRNKEWGVR